MASTLTRRKSVEDTLATTEEEGFQLKRELSALDVIVLGIGVIIGAGIFVLVGEVAVAENAGPSVALSFVVAGVACALAALCYAEFASMVPAAGSAYTYTLATLGEIFAFLIGWDLVLEFTIGASAVAVGFAGYLNSLLDQLFGVTLPAAITSPPGDGGTVNLFAAALVAVVTLLLVCGIRVTAKANIVFVVLILLVLLLVIAVGGASVDTDNWSPFAPAGFAGVVNAASLVFFAYIGFDVVATTAEETRNPRRDMPIGIIGSLAITTAIYLAVALVLTGLVPFRELDPSAPVAEAFTQRGQDWMAAFVYAGAILATVNTVLVLILGQSRVAFAMSRDHLLPPALARTHPRYGTPARITLITGAVVAVLAALVPLSTLVELVNIGTLAAFTLVAVAVGLLRIREPGRERPFRVPVWPVTTTLAAAAAIYLMTRLPGSTWVRFLIWMAIGLAVYFLYARRRSVLAQGGPATPRR